MDKKTWKKHQSFLNRLDRFPLDKAEYYARLKEIYGVNTVRVLAEITGEDYSQIAKTLKILSLPDEIKDFLRDNKENPVIIKYFHIRRLLDIVRQGEEKLQYVRFKELMEEV